MQTQYLTDRLLLKILNEDFAADVLEFMSKNKDFFEPWDFTREDNFYTLPYQQEMLRVEYSLFKNRSGMRYWLFDKDNPCELMGSVSFSYLNDDFHDSSIGYKLGLPFQGHGYAYEAASFLIPLIIQEFPSTPLHADIMPANFPSISLIERLGFKFQCIAFKNHEICGVRQDHLRYVYPK